MQEQLYDKVFTWAELPQEEVRHGVRRCAFATDDYMLVMNYIDAEMTPNPHTHADFDQFAYIVSGRCIYNVGSTPHELAAGSFILVPAGVEHYIQPLGGPVENLDVFSPPRADYQHLLDYGTELTGTGRND